MKPTRRGFWFSKLPLLTRPALVTVCVLLCAAALSWADSSAPVWVSTFAGTGQQGGEDGYRTNASFASLGFIKMDAQDRIWVLEATLTGFWSVGPGAHRIRIIDSDGMVTTLAGGTEPGLVDGPGAEARFRGPTDVAFDSAGNAFVTDRINHLIRKIDAEGMVSTFAGSGQGFQDGTGTNAMFYGPIGITIDGADNLYVADFGNTRIRKITPEGVVTTVAGSVPGSQNGDVSVATFNGPNDVAVAPDGTLYVSDWANGLVRKISPEGVVSTFAEGMMYNHSVAVDGNGDVYAVCGGCYALVKFSPSGDRLWTYQPARGFQDGAAATAQFAFFSDGLVLPDGNYLLSDALNYRLRLITMGVRPMLSIHPAGGEFTNAVTVTISSTAGNAVVLYTTDGSDPRPGSLVYTDAITLTNSATVKARAYVNGLPVSDVVSATFAVTSARCAPIPDGLVGWWPLEGDAADVAGGNAGQVSGDPVFSIGEVGRAMSFDFNDDHIRVPAGPGLDVGQGGGLTLEGWIKPWTVEFHQPLVEWNDNQGTIGAHFWISVAALSGGPGSLWANLVDTNDQPHQISSGPGLLVADEFQHVALTYDQASGLATLYVNGGVVAETNLGTFPLQTRCDLYFGLRPSGVGAGSRYWGDMDEISLYNRALSASELQAVYLAGSAGKCTSPQPPAITAQPQSQSVLLGAAVGFSAAASGSMPLHYQWARNGVAMVGANEATLIMHNVQPADAGLYTVVVSNGAGAVTSEVATLTVVVERSLAVVSPPDAREGDVVSVPLELVSQGEVAGMTFTLQYDPDRLAVSEVVWDAAFAGALTGENTEALGEIRFVFAFPATTVPPGRQTVATVNFRARSVLADTTSDLILQVVDVSDATGDLIPYGTEARGGSVRVLSSGGLYGDNNGNGQLDAGDAILALRLLAGLDSARPWDVALNDLNQNGRLDSGDVIRILRASSETDPPPLPAGPARSGTAPSAPAGSGGAGATEARRRWC